MQEGSLFSTPSPAFVSCRLGVLVFHCYLSVPKPTLLYSALWFWGLASANSVSQTSLVVDSSPANRREIGKWQEWRMGFPPGFFDSCQHHSSSGSWLWQPFGFSTTRNSLICPLRSAGTPSYSLGNGKRGACALGSKVLEIPPATCYPTLFDTTEPILYMEEPHPCRNPDCECGKRAN